ncbi:MAG: penicillin-binding protein 2 [Geodermatophilaceae bacterium]|nr:penicillin-binding protein 2 [Geodermatophilaceae bacterium]MDQ3465913.1 penicillin-binding protein 2 [Actinomycetota bacterium]
MSPRRGTRRLRLSDPHRRVRFGLAVVLTVLTIIGGRLVQLQGLDGMKYAAAAEELRLTRLDLPAARGQILDRDGNALAYSVEARAIFADPGMIVAPGRTALALAPLLATSADALMGELTADGRFVYLARGLDPAGAQAIMDLQLAGIGELVEQRREYPAEWTAAQVVGFVGQDDTGLAGIEDQYDDVLTGTPGQLVYEQGRFGLPIPAATHSLEEAVPGSDVQLTLDQDLQFTLEQALAVANENAGVSSAQAVVLDVATGQVLAMGGSPGYNAADPGGVRGDQLANPTVSHVIEPGSVNKMITFAGALEEGLITPETELTVPDNIAVSDIVINDAWGHAPIHFTATGILGKSSNVGTVMLAQQLGNARLEEYLRRFGLGTATGIELPAESNGILLPHEEWSGSQAGTIPFGQGVSMTVLQMASMFQAVANDGVLVPPRIVDQVIGPDGTVIDQPGSEPRRVLEPDTSADLRYMLESVTNEGGTAPLARIDGYRVAGKTGTAQRPNPECRCYAGGGYWATFAGFAPADDPRYVIAISVEQPGGSGGGGVIAAPVFTSIMSFALGDNGVAPTGTPSPEFRLTTDED